MLGYIMMGPVDNTS